MRKFSKGLCVSLALVLSLFVSGAAAHDKDHGNGKGRDKHADRDKDRDHDGDRDKDRDSHGPSSRPAGWDKGKKTGWGNCDVPPGQAKKTGCNPSNSARTSHHVDHVKRVNHDQHVRHDDRRDRVANRPTTDAHRTTHRDTHHDVKPVPTANNQAAPAKSGSRIERPRTAALQK
jgi:hypothetical protein